MAADGARILVVDDEPDIRQALVTVLERDGFSCDDAGTGEEAVETFDADPFDLVITDIRMPGISGLDVMRRVKSRAPDTIVVLITAHASLDTAIEAVREGASDYITKPVRFENLILKVRNLLRMRDLEWENRILRIERPHVSYFDGIIGKSSAICELRQSITRIGPTPGNVLIDGESGTGKELVAHAIHAASPDRRGAFVAVNCGSIPDTLLESEFFGYKRGAFTGADQDRDGLFQQARRGTLFLDEVAELPLNLQPKVLRAIETKVVRPLGASQDVPVDVRIVAATNKKLDELVTEGRFREDLYFRLNVFSVRVPALHERIDDIPLLANHFLDVYRAEVRSPVEEISADAMAVLKTYPWRGNVRELQNVIQRALITASRPVLDSGVFSRLLGMAVQRDRNLKKAMRDFELYHVRRVVEESGGDKRAAAEQLGISLASLYNKLKE
jgi:two-component system response regulator PilR (NtrC family)